MSFDSEPTSKKKIIALLDNAWDNISIDVLSLNEEFMRQPNLFAIFMDAEASINRLKDMYESNLNSKIREEYVDKNSKSPSEAYVEKQIKLDKEYIELSYLCAKTAGIVKSIDNKKRSLEVLSDREGKGLFSAPKDMRNYQSNNWRVDEETIKKTDLQQKKNLSKYKRIRNN